MAEMRYSDSDYNPYTPWGRFDGTLSHGQYAFKDHNPYMKDSVYSSTGGIWLSSGVAQC